MASLNAPAAVDHLPGMVRRFNGLRNPSEVEACVSSGGHVREEAPWSAWLSR